MTRLEKALTAVLSAVVLSGGGFAVGRVAAQTARPCRAPRPARRRDPPPAPPLADSPPSARFRGPTRRAGYTNDQLATQIAEQAGTALAAHSPGYVAPPRVRQLGSAIPAGAQVNARANTITFSTRTVSFTVVAVPPGGPDMAFRIAGLTNPAVIVPPGATVQGDLHQRGHRRGPRLGGDQRPGALPVRLRPRSAGRRFRPSARQPDPGRRRHRNDHLHRAEPAATSTSARCQDTPRWECTVNSVSADHHAPGHPKNCHFPSLGFPAL